MMLYRVPSCSCQTTNALPELSTPTFGLSVVKVVVSRATATPHPTPATYRFAQMLYRVPSHCCHVAKAVPPLFIAI